MLRRTLLASPLAALALAAPAWSHTAGHKPDQPAAQGKAEPVPAETNPSGTRDAATYFTNLELLNQEGRKLRFYADVLEGKTVMINVIYTNCSDACPLITQQLNNVRRRLPEFGKEIHFVTLTSDPKRDTPQALKAFAKKQSADVEGWTFLTGSKDNIEHILKKLGTYSADVESHSTLLIAGNVPAKRWSKMRADAPAEAIAARLIVLAGGDGTLVPVPGAPAPVKP